MADFLNHLLKLSNIMLQNWSYHKKICPNLWTLVLYDSECCDVLTSALPHVKHALCFMSSTLSIVLNSFWIMNSYDCELHDTCTMAQPCIMQGLPSCKLHLFFSYVLWTLLWPWTPGCTHFRSALCDTCTAHGQLYLAVMWNLKWKCH